MQTCTDASVLIVSVHMSVACRRCEPLVLLPSCLLIWCCVPVTAVLVLCDCCGMAGGLLLMRTPVGSTRQQQHAAQTAGKRCVCMGGSVVVWWCVILSKHVGQQGARHVAVVPAGWVRERVVLETHPHQVVVCTYQRFEHGPARCCSRSTSPPAGLVMSEP